jgi:hypothetical protein
MGLTVSLSGNSSDDQSGNMFEATRPVADVDTTLTYHHRGRRIEFGLNTQSVVRRAESSIMPMRQQAAFDITFTGLRQQFQASQTASYSPTYQFGGTADLTGTPELESAEAHGDFANASLAAITLSSNIDWTRTLSRRFSASARYNVQRTTFDRAGLDMMSQEAGFSLSRRLSRYASLRTGYGYRVANYALTAAEPLRVHDLDVGIDVSRPVASSKRTTVNFGTGSSLMPANGRLAFNITGDAMVMRRIGRTWAAQLGAKRSVRLVEGFAHPALDNSIRTGIAGNLQRHVTLSASASVATGRIGLESGRSNAYANWTTASGVSIALGRRMSLDAQYYCVGERFNKGVTLPPGYDGQRRVRQGLRLGFTVRAPLIG